jgi:hypothetical protein
MGNCCSSGAADGGYPLKPLGGEKNEVTQGQPIRTAGMAANSDQDRAKRLAAAEERQKKVNILINIAYFLLRYTCNRLNNAVFNRVAGN